jgi:hypothetical protein
MQAGSKKRGKRLGKNKEVLSACDFIPVRKTELHEGSCQGCYNSYFPVFTFNIGMFKARLCRECWKKLKLGFELTLLKEKE